MATAGQKQQIREKARNGDSVNQIKEELGLPKSTVYYHFKKEVGQKQKENALKLPENEEVMGEICGVFAGDGNFHKKKKGNYRIRIFLNLEDSYSENLADFLEENLDKRPNIYNLESKTRTTLDYSSKKLYKMLKKYLDWKEDKTSTIRPNTDKDLSTEFKIGFLRGLLDTDGHKDTTRKRYSFNTVSPKLAGSISNFLSDLNIKHVKKSYSDERENYKDVHRVYINGEHTQKISSIIDPRHPKKRRY